MKYSNQEILVYCNNFRLIRFCSNKWHLICLKITNLDYVNDYLKSMTNIDIQIACMR